MRNELEKYLFKRVHFVAVVDKYGKIKEKKNQTILLKEIKDKDGEAVVGHQWIRNTVQLQQHGWLKKGDTIEFSAMITKYVKGYVNPQKGIDNRGFDYRICSLKDIKITRKQRFCKPCNIEITSFKNKQTQ